MNNPLAVFAKFLDVKLTQDIQGKTIVAVDAALSEVPILASLLKGEEVTLQVKIQLKGNDAQG